MNDLATATQRAAEPDQPTAANTPPSEPPPTETSQLAAAAVANMPWATPPPAVPVKLLAYTPLHKELGISRRTLDRKRQLDPTFPRIIWINGRAYLVSNEWEQYKAHVIRRAIESPALNHLMPAKRRARAKRLAEAEASA
jgi:hypothetical protein